MPLRLVQQYDVDQMLNGYVREGDPMLCVHGESLTDTCEECYAQCQKLPIDLDKGETLAIVIDDDGMEDV